MKTETQDFYTPNVIFKNPIPPIVPGLQKDTEPPFILEIGLITFEVVSTNRPKQAPLTGPFNNSALPTGCDMYLYLNGCNHLVLTTSISH